MYVLYNYLIYNKYIVINYIYDINFASITYALVFMIINIMYLHIHKNLKTNNCNDLSPSQWNFKDYPVYTVGTILYIF